MSLSPRSLVACLALTVGLFAATVFVPVGEELRLEPGRLAADGSSSARLRWSMRGLLGHRLPLWPWDVELRVVEGAERVRLLGRSRRVRGPAELELALVGRDQPGPVELELLAGPWRHRLSLQVVAGPIDGDEDGFPDAAELCDEADRRAFADWFAAIAESQFYQSSPSWPDVHRDCAGLLRFAYKEALRAHDQAWLARFGYLHRRPGADIARFSYPQVPLLGTRLFRASAGGYRGPDDFSSSASARVLAEHNARFVSKGLEEARPGDLLFFYDPEQPGSGYHSMVLLDGARLVYHTGSDGQEAGEVRLVGVADLNAHGDERWHLRRDNPNFLGVYRWKILEGGRP